MTIEAERAAARFDAFRLGAENVVDFLGGYGSVCANHSGGHSELTVAEDVALWEDG